MYDYMQMDNTKLIQTEEITEKWQYTIKFAFFLIFMKGEKNYMVYYVMKHEDRNSTLITTYDP